MNTSIRRLTILLSLGATQVACNSYDPDLGETPFRCGDTEPRCPDGYQAVSAPVPVDCECVRAESISTEAPAIMFECADDSDRTGDPGGNEDTDSAHITLVGPGVFSQMLSGLSICPASDVDVFQLATNSAGTDILVRIQYNQRVGELTLEILDSSGAPVASGSVGTSSQTARYVASAPGVYFARVKAADGALENNYTLQIELDEP